MDPHHVNKDLDPDPSFLINGKTLKKCSNWLIHTFWEICKIDADRDLVQNPAYHFDADPDPYFYLMRILIWILYDVDPNADPGY